METACQAPFPRRKFLKAVGVALQSYSPAAEANSQTAAPFPAIDEQLKVAKGYDHNFVVRGGGAGKLVPAARICDPQSGRALEVLTTQPAVLFYSGQKLGAVGTAFAMELQHMPDAPNKPHLPSTILRAGKRYHQTSILRFSVEPASLKP